MKQKTSRRIYWGATLLFAAFMLLSGAMELMNGPDAQKALVDLGYPIYLNIIIGVAKVLGAVALIQPKYNTLKEWAYAGFTIDLIGASASFVLVGAGLLSTLPMLPFFIVLFTSYYFWKKSA